MAGIRHSLSGPLTIYEVARLREELLGILADTRELRLDCREAARCDSAFLQMLCALSRSCKRRGILFSLIPGAVLSEAAARIGLDLSGEMRLSDGDA